MSNSDSLRFQKKQNNFTKWNFHFVEKTHFSHPVLKPPHLQEKPLPAVVNVQPNKPQKKQKQDSDPEFSRPPLREPHLGNEHPPNIPAQRMIMVQVSWEIFADLIGSFFSYHIQKWVDIVGAHF